MQDEHTLHNCIVDEISDQFRAGYNLRETLSCLILKQLYGANFSKILVDLSLKKKVCNHLRNKIYQNFTPSSWSLNPGHSRRKSSYAEIQ